MTYRELANAIATMNDEQLDSDVTVYDANVDEHCSGVELVYTTDACDVLDPNHPVIRF